MGVFLLIVLPLCGFALLYIMSNLALPDKPRRQGIYATPGGTWYSFKWCLMYLLLKLRHRQKNEQNKLGDKPAKGECRAGGYGTNSHESGEEMELFTNIGQHPQVIRRFATQIFLSLTLV